MLSTTPVRLLIAALLLLFAASGAGASLCSVAGRTLLQRTAPERLLGRVFGVLEGLSMLAMAVGSVGIGFVIARAGVPAGLLLTGLVVPVALITTWRELGALDRHARPPDPEALELLRGLEIFRPLSAPAIELILAELEWLDVPAGTTVIRQGDPGDRFYVVADGGPKPYRVRVRPPSFIHLMALESMCVGRMVADVVACIGTIDIVLGEVDR